jgi:hypothetical protein
MFGFGAANDALAKLVSRVASLYEELVKTTTKFDEVRTYTRESIDEFKRLIERQSDKIERIERERVKAEAELLSKISGLESRLNALSEQALHRAAEDFFRKIQGSSNGENQAQRRISKPPE